jgi:glycosyltransferase involved in cell wall biosynthesis
VHISTQLVPDMTHLFHAADATIAPFTRRLRMKVCPTSLIESLACGRPLLVSSKVGIAGLVRDEECGVVFAPTVDGLCRGVAELRSRHQYYLARARPAAARHFDIADCLAQHEHLYDEVLRTC